MTDQLRTNVTAGFDADGAGGSIGLTIENDPGIAAFDETLQYIVVSRATAPIDFEGQYTDAPTISVHFGSTSPRIEDPGRPIAPHLVEA